MFNIFMSTQSYLQGAPPVITSLTGLAKSLALPHEFKPQRYPSFPALERTSVLGFNYNSLLTVGPNTRALLVRDPVYPYWAERTPYLVGNSWSASLLCTPPTKIDDLISDTAGGALISNEPFDYELDDSLAGVNTGNNVCTFPSSNMAYVMTGASSPDWIFPVIGVDIDLPGPSFVYVPSGFRLSIVQTFAGVPLVEGTANIMYILECWATRGRTNTIFNTTVATTVAVGDLGVATVNVNLGAAYWVRVKACHMTLVAPAGGRYIFKSSQSAITLVVHDGTATFTKATKTLSVLGSATNTLLPVAVCKEFVNSALPWADTKVTAVSVLATNVTKVLNKEGTVLAGRLSPRMGIGTFWSFTPSMLELLHPAEKAYMGLEQGFYTYCPPTSDMNDFANFTIPIGLGYAVPSATLSGGTLYVLPVFGLQNMSFANAMVFQDPDAGTNLALNVDWHIEYRNNSTLFEVGMSAITLEQFHQAQLALASVGFFFGNETHMERIKRILKQVATWANRAAPMVSMVSPVVGKGMQMASDLVLSSKPNSGVEPTTLAVAPRRSPSTSSVRSTGSARSATFAMTPKKKVVTMAGLTKKQRKKLAEKEAKS